MRGNRLTSEQRMLLLELYLADPKQAKRLAKKLGVGRTYAAQLTSRRGTPRIDHRWEWAKQRGEVVA